MPTVDVSTPDALDALARDLHAVGACDPVDPGWGMSWEEVDRRYRAGQLNGPDAVRADMAADSLRAAIPTRGETVAEFTERTRYWVIPRYRVAASWIVTDADRAAYVARWAGLSRMLSEVSRGRVTLPTPNPEWW